MSLTENQKEQIRQSSKAWIDQASLLYAKKFDEIEIRFDLRGRTSGMFCCLGRDRFIRYNDAIFARYFEESMEHTVPHEIAHYIVFSRFGKRAKPHGKEWKQVMLDFDRPAHVTCKLDVKDLSHRTLRRYLYKCGCSQHELSSIRHNRIVRGIREYGCPKCHQPLVAEAAG